MAKPIATGAAQQGGSTEAVNFKIAMAAKLINQAASRKAVQKAIDMAGSLKALAEAIGYTEHHLEDCIEADNLHPEACQSIELHTRVLNPREKPVTCEELRPDLFWIRDGAPNEPGADVVGYVTKLPGADLPYVMQTLRSNFAQERGAAEHYGTLELPKRDGCPGWNDLLRDQDSYRYSVSSLETLSNAARNEFITLAEGLKAIGELQWIAAGNKSAPIESRTLHQLGVLTISLVELLDRLNAIESNAEHNLHHPHGSIAKMQRAAA